MTLPTVQPVDWPDWGNAPTFTTSEYSVAPVTGTGQVLAEVTVGYFSHAVIIFYPTFPLENFSVAIEVWTAGVSEGGSLLYSQPTVIDVNQTVVVPMTNVGTSLRVVSFQSTAYPHSAAFSITLFAQAGYMTGWPGGIFALAQAETIGATSELPFVPPACGPGEHSVNVTTDGAAWNLFLVTFIEADNAVVTLLADDTTPAPYNIRFLAPASSWHFVYENLDATDAEVALIVTRAPM